MTLSRRRLCAVGALIALSRAETYPGGVPSMFSPLPSPRPLPLRPMEQPVAIATPHAPKAIGPYSQAVRAGGVLYCSGQIALSPSSGELVGKTAAEQAVQVLENLSQVLTAGGSSAERVLRCTVYLVDMADFAAVNEVYARYFAGPTPPARATVAVAALPRGARVEIDAVALCAN